MHLNVFTRSLRYYIDEMGKVIAAGHTDVKGCVAGMLFPQFIEVVCGEKGPAMVKIVDTLGRGDASSSRYQHPVKMWKLRLNAFFKAALRRLMNLYANDAFLFGMFQPPCPP